MSAIYEHLELLGPRILVRPLRELDVTKGGIVMPDSARHQQNRAIVERVGPGEQLDTRLSLGVVHRALSFKAGDLVLYQKFAGVWTVLDEKERLILMEDEITGRVPAEFVDLVHAGDDAHEHLEGEPCQLCQHPQELEAQANLERMRDEHVHGTASGSESLG